MNKANSAQITSDSEWFKVAQDTNDTNIALTTGTFDDNGLLLKDKTTPIELRYIGYGHSNTMIVAYLPKQRLILGVDFINNDSMAWRDLPNVNIDELIAMQTRLLDIDFSIIAFGHNRPGDKKTVLRQIEYYQTLLTESERAIKKSFTEDQLVKNINLPQYRHWGNYDNWFKMNVRGSYRWVKNRSKK